jgi:hypothetical protein
LHDPQPGDDMEAPQIIISQGSKVEAFITAPIEIDASPSYDNQKISRVWWMSDGQIFLDSNNEKYSVRELLKIKLPAKNSPQTFSVTLNIADESGNFSTQEIPIEVKAPNLKLTDVSRREQTITGKITEGINGLRVGFLRERNGRKDILEKTTLSEKNGKFILRELGTEGNIVLKNKYSKENFAEILPTGRPILTNKKEAHTRLTTPPFAIKIADSHLSELADLTIKTSSKDDIQVHAFEKEIPAKLAEKSKSILVVDSNDNDNFVWESFTEGVSFLDSANHKTVGILNNNGIFTTTDYLSDLIIKPKKAETDNDPLVFQIFREKNKLAEFFIPIKKVIVQ